jgi:hypothetical protein
MGTKREKLNRASRSAPDVSLRPIARVAARQQCRSQDQRQHHNGQQDQTAHWQGRKGSAPRKMKTSQSYIARIEGGKVRPSTDVLGRFAEATGTRLRIVFEPHSTR